jgi:phenylalanyl-tRNA synthetase beta subunit
MHYREDAATWKNDPWIETVQALKASLVSLGIQDAITITPTALPYYHTHKQGALMVGETLVGEIGQLHPRITDAGKLNEASMVVFGAIDITAAISCIAARKVLTPVTNQDHILTRDVCFVLPRDTGWESLISAVRGLQ